MKEMVYLNGSLVPRAQAHLSPDDQGFLYGFGLFETMRAYHGRIFLLERHVARLLAAARAIGLAGALAGMDLGRACRETLAANGLQTARLRLTVTRGEADSFPGDSSRMTPTVLVTARPYTPLAAEVYQRGFQAGVSSLRRCRQSLLTGIKATSYLPNLLARLEAGAAGLDEALFLNEEGWLTEGGTSSVFFVSAGMLLTPPLAGGILPGITRGVVMEMAGNLGLAAAEVEVMVADLERFDEAFLTSSVMEIMPLVAVRDSSGKAIVIGSGRPGEVTTRLMAAYQEMVAKETA